MNEACLHALNDFQKAAEAKAKIEEVESHKERGSAPVSTSALPPVLPGYPGVAMPPSFAPRPIQTVPQVAEKPFPPRLPVIVMILSDAQDRPTATLRLPEGGSVDVTRGSLLPDGTSVAAIDGNTVYVRRGHTLMRLPMDNGQSLTPVADDRAPTQGQALPAGSYPMLGGGIPR
ncbi:MULTISPECIES: type IV pilus biogenesis protein PilP [Asaia]|nr:MULTISPECIES: type IV pilus biogenesis protein PilP [Asaia]